MKRTIFSLVMLLCAVFVSAQGTIGVKTKGGINPTKWNAKETATVTVSRIPASVEEFEAVQAQLGDKPEGAVMLQLLAMEMFNRDKTIGTECVKLANVTNNYNSILSRLPDIFNKNYPGYARPHLVATYFEGSTPQNGFNPKAPYSIKVRTRANRQYARSEMLKGYVLYLEVYSSGYDSSWRGVEVIRQKGSPFFKVSNSPAMYLQCKEVPFDSDEDYKGLK